MYRDNATEARARLDSALQRRDAAQAAASEQREAIVELNRQLAASGKPAVAVPSMLDAGTVPRDIDKLSLAQLHRAAADVEADAARCERIRDENAALVKMLGDRVLGREGIGRKLSNPPRRVPITYVPDHFTLCWFVVPLLLDILTLVRFGLASRYILWGWSAAIAVAGLSALSTWRIRHFLRWAKEAQATVLDKAVIGHADDSENSVLTQARGWEPYVVRYTGSIYRNRVRFMTDEGESGEVRIEGMEYEGGVVLYDSSRPGPPRARALESLDSIATPWPMPDGRGEWIESGHPKRLVVSTAVVWAVGAVMIVVMFMSPS